MSDLSEVERKAQALRLRQQGRQAGEGSTAGSTGGGKAATEGTALLGGDEVDDVDLPKPAIKADKADTDRCVGEGLAEQGGKGLIDITRLRDWRPVRCV